MNINDEMNRIMAEGFNETAPTEHRPMTPADFEWFDEIPEGGDCDLCGRWSSELIDGACEPCRQTYGDDK